jgi:hypothetical protein
MKYFSYYIPDYFYANTITAPSIEQAEDCLTQNVTLGNHWGLHEITKEEYLKLQSDGKN